MKAPAAYGGYPAVPPLPAIPGSQSIVNLLLAEGVDTVFGYLGASVLPLCDRFHDSTIRPSDAKNTHYDKQEIPMSKNNSTENNVVRKPGSQIIVDILQEQGTEVMFGYLGGVVLPLFDKIYDSPIKFIIPRHEQGGCHMADAYARATGKVGVVIATSGPGATNLVTGIATAMMDSVPMVAITGQVRTELIGNDSFQEADTTGITRPITKHNMIIKNPAELPQALREAFYIAKTGRPGPVLIDVPVDMQLAQIAVSQPQPVELPGFRHRIRGHARQISIAAQAINEAQKPVLYVGGGVVTSNATEELRDFAKKANIPVTMTLLGL
jgi:acetolactate synthase I/II/III large subunit